MKNIKKKHQELLQEYYGKSINRFLQAIEDADVYVVDIEEVKKSSGHLVYLRLQEVSPDRYVDCYHILYLSFGQDDLINFYAGEEKGYIAVSRFSPEGLTEFLRKWFELQKLCRNYL